MKYILFSLAIMFMNPIPNEIDFGQEKSGTNWQVINDGVMGGLSQGRAQLQDNTILFKGKVSLENNGGFASLKSSFQDIDLSAYKQVKIRLKNKGIAFAMTLETNRNWFYPYFKQRIQVQSEDWEVVTLSLEDFNQYRIGQKTGKQLSADDQGAIIRLGIISDEKRAGDFEIEVDYILFES